MIGAPGQVHVPFNTPFEVGFRSVVVLGEVYEESADIQRLVYFDYLLIHSGDAPDGPRSLHPATPFRAEEFAIRRDILRRGLLLMASRGLVDIAVTRDGIEYAATDATIPFLDRLTSDYTKALRQRAEWLRQTFGAYQQSELASYFSRNLGRWGSEFMFMRDFSAELTLLDNRASDGLST